MNIRICLPLLTILLGGMLFLSFNIYPKILANGQQLIPSSPATDTGLPTIQITSPQDGQQVTPGKLTIQGISSDDDETDCNVYADVNDITPMRNVTAAGISREKDDFSQWTFTYSQDYQLIKEGENELTAKITCINDGEFDLKPAGTVAATNSPLSEWHTVNVTAVAGDADVVGSNVGNGASNLGENCDPSYPDVCIPSHPPKLNCGEIPSNNIRVVPPDPHGLDGNDNGIGCEEVEGNNETEDDEPAEDNDDNNGSNSSDEVIENNNDDNDED